MHFVMWKYLENFDNSFTWQMSKELFVYTRRWFMFFTHVIWNLHFTILCCICFYTDDEPANCEKKVKENLPGCFLFRGFKLRARNRLFIYSFILFINFSSFAKSVVGSILFRSHITQRNESMIIINFFDMQHKTSEGKQ